VVIGAEFGRFDPSQLRLEGGWNHLMLELTPNQIQLVVKTKKKY
jgi:hypothetical protein